MVIKGGDILQFSYAGREFIPSPDADVTFMLSGKDLTNTLGGNGKLITIAKRRAAGIDGMVVVLDDANKDLEFLVNIQTTAVPKPITLTLASGITYAGSGVIEGEGLGKSTATGIATISLRGERLEQI
jgi:hypothetical protein